MSEISDQMKTWLGPFGQAYTDRNILSTDQTDARYKRKYGLTRTELTDRFLGAMSLDIPVLEVGCNVGNKLLSLQSMGFQNLYGLELQSYAIKLATTRTSRLNLIQGSGLNIPYPDGSFDVVFTAGVLIHIHPSDIATAMKEIYRCTRQYIWGVEYYDDTYTHIPYRGHENLLWKTNFAKLYLELFDDLELVKEERLPYLGDDDNIDSAFLLRKIKKS